MTWASLAELLLFTKAHYEAWLAAWYLSQIQPVQAKPSMQAAKVSDPPKPQAAPVFQPQLTVPEYSAMTLF